MYDQVSIQGSLVIALDLLRAKRSSAHMDSLILALRQQKIPDVSVFRLSKTSCEKLYGQSFVGGPYALLQGRPTDTNIFLVTGPGTRNLSDPTGKNIRYALVSELSEEGLIWDNFDLHHTFPNEYARLDNIFSQVQGNLLMYFTLCLKPHMEHTTKVDRTAPNLNRAKIPIAHGLSIDVDTAKFDDKAIAKLMDVASQLTQGE